MGVAGAVPDQLDIGPATLISLLICRYEFGAEFAAPGTQARVMGIECRPLSLRETSAAHRPKIWRRCLSGKWLPGRLRPEPQTVWAERSSPWPLPSKSTVHRTTS